MLEYVKYRFYIKFEKKANFQNPPTYLLRSVLGNKLRNLTCVRKTKTCTDCLLTNKCIYSYFFETTIDKNNEILKGVNKFSHPYVLSVGSDFGNTDSFFDIVIIGKAINYFPYIYYAFKNAGETGILNNRIKYTIIDVKSDSISIIENNSINNSYVKTWEYSNDIINQDYLKLNIELVTPLRAKINNYYLNDINYEDFIKLIKRRIFLLNKLYGDKDYMEDCITDYADKKVIKKLFWADFDYYSGRQNKELKMGGIIGTFSVEGLFSRHELSLLEFAEFFNIGKNVSFGLGHIKIKRG